MNLIVSKEKNFGPCTKKIKFSSWMAMADDVLLLKANFEREIVILKFFESAFCDERTSHLTLSMMECITFVLYAVEYESTYWWYQSRCVV